MVRSLDDVQDERYAASSLHGDAAVEADSRLPVFSIDLAQSEPAGQAVDHGASVLSLGGAWVMNSCAPPDYEAEQRLVDRRQPLAHSRGVLEGWAEPNADRSHWIAAQVPGTVHGALRKAGLLEDPFWDTNSIDELAKHGTPEAASWHFRKTRVEQQEWWYATNFEVPSAWAGERLELCFDGLDYAASVYLNGQPLGNHVGMFGGPDLDVTSMVVAVGPNTLVIRFDPPPHHWYGVLKGSPGWGWHYGHLISIGPWRDVFLRRVTEIEVKHLAVTTVELSEKLAELDLEFDVTAKAAQPGAATIDVTLTPADCVGRALSLTGTVSLSYGTTRFRTRLALPSPKAWWPRGYGEQPLYRATVAVTVRDATHETSRTVGVRTIEMAAVEKCEGEDFYRWRFVVNGRPLYVKGANWCWTDPYLSTPFPERMLDLTVRSNVQMLRAWGGGLIESDEFYDYCDRVGILVYQEFPLSFGPNDSPATDLGVIDRQAQRIVRRLRHHPSLVMWGGGNENEPPRGFDEALFLLGRRCRQYDRSRPFHRTDPWGGSVHNYDVFHMGRPIDSGYANLPSVWYGEFGIPSMPSRLNVARFLPDSALDHWPPTLADRGVIAHMHQFTLLDFMKVLRYADYGPIADWDTFIRYTQLAQADALRFASERQRANPEATAGFWFYKMTELFPGASWGVIDFYGAPKPAYYRAQQFCRPRHLFATYDRFDWAPGEQFAADVYLSNDTPAPWASGTIRARLYDSSLQVVAEEVFAHGTIPPDSTERVGGVRTAVDSSMLPFFLAVDRVDDSVPQQGSWYWFNVKQKSDDVRKLESTYIRHFPVAAMPGAFTAYAAGPGSRIDCLPRTELVAAAVSTDDGQWTLTITNTGTLPALEVRVFDGGDGTAGFVSASHFGLHPGAVAALTVELGPGQDIRDFDVRGWNSDAVAVRTRPDEQRPIRTR